MGASRQERRPASRRPELLEGVAESDAARTLLAQFASLLGKSEQTAAPTMGTVILDAIALETSLDLHRAGAKHAQALVQRRASAGGAGGAGGTAAGGSSGAAGEPHVRSESGLDPMPPAPHVDARPAVLARAARGGWPPNVGFAHVGPRRRGSSLRPFAIGEVAFGKPVIAGTRIPAATVIGQLAAGIPEAELCAEYDLQPEQLRAALRYAAWLAEQDSVRASA